MDLSFLLKIAGVGIIVAVSCQVLSKLGRDEQATMVSIAGIIVAFLMVIKELANMLDAIKSIFGL